jgi:hypothetical protein
MAKRTTHRRTSATLATALECLGNAYAYPGAHDLRKTAWERLLRCLSAASGPAADSIPYRGARHCRPEHVQGIFKNSCVPLVMRFRSSGSLISVAVPRSETVAHRARGS